MANARLIVEQESRRTELPVTWQAQEFLECEDLYDQLFASDDIVDWDAGVPDLTVILDSDSRIQSRVNWTDEAGLVYPSRNLDKLLEKVNG